MDAEVRSASAGELTVQHVVQRYPLEPGLWLTLTPDADTWRCGIETDPAAPDEARERAADALTHLLRYANVPAVSRFHLVRHVPAPECTGERPMDDDGRVVVVGERVVVRWTRTVRDVPYNAPVTLAQLAAVDFLGIPDTHGLLVWNTPSGHEAPLAVATRYLPRAVDGGRALATLLERDATTEPMQTPALTSRMGRIAAALHVALATRSSVLAEPVRGASADDLTRWHERVQATVDRAALTAAGGGLGVTGERFLDRLRTWREAADLLGARVSTAHEVAVQRVHGDLHVNRVLRWAGGLAITGFGDEPESDALALGPQSATRDLARLLQSLEHLVDSLEERTEPGRLRTEWLPGARCRVLTAYRTELAVAGRTDLFDEGLLTAFEAEHAARQVLAEAQCVEAAQSLDDLPPPAWPDLA